TGAVIVNEASRFNPPDFATGSDKAKLVDKLAPPSLERAYVLGAQALHIVSVHTREPLFGANFHGAVRQTVDCCTGARDPHASCRNIVGIRAHARRPMGKVELRIAFREAGLGTLAHANVLNDGEEIVDGAVNLAHAADREIRPDDAAILADVALLDAIAAGLAGERPLQYREIGCKIVRVCNVLKGLGLEFLARIDRKS